MHLSWTAANGVPVSVHHVRKQPASATLSDRRLGAKKQLMWLVGKDMQGGLVIERESLAVSHTD
jgi:hypothetical protein